MHTNLYSFPKSARLLKKPQYQAVFEGACKVSNDTLTILARVNQLSKARLGLAISHKCSKRSVERNRIKRILRETFRVAKLDLPGLDLVVTCKPNAVHATNVTLKTAFLSQINKICQKISAN